jgi:hypothetical protein
LLKINKFVEKRKRRRIENFEAGEEEQQNDEERGFVLIYIL